MEGQVPPCPALGCRRNAHELRAFGCALAGESGPEKGNQLAEIISNAERQQEIIKGDADAEATRIYNEAYSAAPEFYAFYRSLESYANSLKTKATLILETDSDYFRYLRDAGTPPQSD